MTIKELRDKRNKLMADAQALIKKDNVTPEDRSAFDKMLADVDVLEADITRLEKIEKYEAEQRAIPSIPRPQPGIDTDTTPEQRKAAEKRAFANYVRFGVVDSQYIHSANPVESRDLGTVTAGSITGGAQLVPQAFYPVLIEAQKSWGDILNIVTERKTSNGAPMKIAMVNDTGNQVTVVGEAVAVTETDPSLSAAVISSTDFLTTGVVKVSLPELQDSAFDVESWLRDSFGKRYFRGLSALVTNGSSSGNIQSIVTSNTNVFTTATAGTLTYADIANTYAKLDPAYIPGASWTMNSTTRGYLLAVEDSFGRPLFIPAPSAEAFDQLLGKPVVLNQSLAAVATGNVAIQFGDFRQGYLYRSVEPGLGIVRLNERYLDSGEIGFIGFARAGGVLTDAGLHPLVNVAIK